MRDPIFIVGPARSGTSMTAGVFKLCGAWTGPTIEANQDNQRGYFENELLCDIVKGGLRFAGADERGVFSFPHSDTQLEHLKTKAQQTIVAQGYDDSVPWLWKSVKLLSMWRTYHKAFPRAKWVLCYRAPRDVARSCMKTSFFERFHKPMTFWQTWTLRHHQFMQEIEAECDAVYVLTQRLVEKCPDELAHLRQQIKQLGLQWGQESVENFIEPELWGKGNEPSNHTRVGR